MKTRRSWWIAYGAGAAVVLLSLGWVTAEVLRLERAELLARADARHQEALRLALWRMDSWLAPRLAREAARPYADYEPFHAPQELYSDALEPVESQRVLTPSPLLSFRSDIIPLHFQISGEGITSPQVPTGGQRAVVEGIWFDAEQIAANGRRLRKLEQKLDYGGVMSCVVAAETTPAPETELKAAPPGVQEERMQAGPEWQSARNRGEFNSRRGVVSKAQSSAQTAQVMTQVDAPDTPPPMIGSLVAIWIEGDGDAPELVFTRRVDIDGEEILQGFLCDWSALRAALLAEIADLFTTASLAPVQFGPPARQDTAMLATIPVALQVPPAALADRAGLTPARFTLALTWLAGLTGIVAVGMTLRSSIAFGQKRSRFASAVTHELRTPLTTFRMYTEMLSDGMVTDEDQRATYLRTLKDESGRLSTLVENVLAYARLEEGRHAAHARETSVKDLLDRVAPTLERRAESAGLRLDVHCDVDESSELRTDVDAVGQILFNLVDNACKYACDGDDRTLELRVARAGERLRMEVADHGPGVPAECARTVFTAFERGENDCGEHPGIGLGLALARSLARDLGGELSLRPPNGDGACFRLDLPVE